MKTSYLMKSYLFIIAFAFLFMSNTFAQDNHKDSCCSTSGTMMNHSMTEKDSVQTSDLKAIEVDSKLEAWNAVCPVRGETIDPEAKKVSYNDKIYGFCCNGCDKKFMKDPEKYSKNLSEDGKNFLGTK